MTEYRKPLFLVLLIMTTTILGCKSGQNVLNAYSIVCARSFSIIEFTSEHPKGRKIYQIDNKGDTIITAVGYNPDSKLLAIATTKKEPEKGAAKILLRKMGSDLSIAEIVTDKYYIHDIAISSDDKIAFSARHLERELPEELSYVDQFNKPDIKILAKAKRISKLSWHNDKKMIYFSGQQGDKRIIAYIDAQKPEVIKIIDEGFSIATSKSGKLAYLRSDGAILFAKKIGQAPIKLDLPSKHTNPQYVDSIEFVYGSEEIILQSYKKSTVYDLLLVKPPYKKVKMLIKNIGMQDYYVIKN